MKKSYNGSLTFVKLASLVIGLLSEITIFYFSFYISMSDSGD